jgi:hypothetical protein
MLEYVPDGCFDKIFKHKPVNEKFKDKTTKPKYCCFGFLIYLSMLVNNATMLKISAILINYT